VTLDVPLTVVQARDTHVIGHQRARHRFAGIEPAIVEWNELKHGALPFDAPPFQHSCVQTR
jgi:hypothetical protein